MSPACLADDGLEHAAGSAEILQVTGFGTPGYLVQPADRSWFETGVRRAFLGVNNLDLHFHGILTALDPAFSSFTSLFHTLLGKIDGDQHRSTAFRQPSPDDLDFPAIGQFLTNHHRWVRFARRAFSLQYRILQTGDQLPDRNTPLLGSLIGMPGHEEAVLAYSRSDSVEQLPHATSLGNSNAVYNLRVFGTVVVGRLCGHTQFSRVPAIADRTFFGERRARELPVSVHGVSSTYGMIDAMLRSGMRDRPRFMDLPADPVISSITRPQVITRLVKWRVVARASSTAACSTPPIASLQTARGSR